MAPSLFSSLGEFSEELPVLTLCHIHFPIHSLYALPFTPTTVWICPVAKMKLLIPKDIPEPSPSWSSLQHWHFCLLPLFWHSALLYWDSPHKRFTIGCGTPSTRQQNPHPYIHAQASFLPPVVKEEVFPSCLRRILPSTGLNPLSQKPRHLPWLLLSYPWHCGASCPTESVPPSLDGPHPHCECSESVYHYHIHIAILAPSTEANVLLS